MKQMKWVDKNKNYTYTTTVGVRKIDDIIIITQKMVEQDITTVVKLKITKFEFDGIVKFVKDKFNTKTK